MTRAKRDTRAISRSAILAKEPSLPREGSSGLATTMAFAIATIGLLYLATSFLLAAAS